MKVIINISKQMNSISKIVLLFVLLFFYLQNAKATTYYWVGGTATTDLTGSVWSTTLGGAAGAATINNTNVFIIDGSNILTGGGTGTVSINISADRTVGQFILQNNATVILTGASAHVLNVGGAIAGTDMSIANGSSLTVSTNAGLTLVASNTATVGGSLTINSGSTLTVSGTSITTSGTLQIDGTLTPAAAAIMDGAGTLTGSGTVQVTRTAATADFIHQYTITTTTLTNLTVEYLATTSVNALTYNNLKLTNNATYTAAGAITVNGTLTVANASGIFDMSTNALSGGGSFSTSITGTVKTSNTTATPIPSGISWGGTFQYAVAAGGQTVIAGTYNNLTVSNTSNSNSESGNITVSAVFTTTAGGKFSIGANILTLNGTSSMSATGYLTGSASSNLTIGGTGALGSLYFDQTTVGTTNKIQNLTINRTSSGTLTIANALVVSTNLYLYNAAVTATTANLTLSTGANIFRTAATLSAAPTFPGTVNVTYGDGSYSTGITTGNELPTSATALNNLTINVSGGVTLNYTGTTKVNGILTLSNGILTTTSGSKYLQVTNSSSAAVTTSSTFSSTNCIEGPFDWTLANGNTYFYPIADASGNYRPVELVNVSCATPVARITAANTGASTVTGSHLTSVNANNWYVQQISGTLTSFTFRITDATVYSTSAVAQSSAQVGTYSNIGSTIASNTVASNSGITLASGAYFALALDAVATKLIFSFSPTYAKINTNFIVTVKAVDANGNLDNDITSSVTLSKSSGTGAFSSATGLTQALSGGIYTWTDVRYTVAETAVLQAAASGLTSTTASIIFVTNNTYYVNDTYTSATDIYTTATGSDGTGAVNDPSHPYASLKTVLGLVSNSDYIFVDAGTYSDQDMSLTKTGITITGAKNASGVPTTNFTRGASHDHYFMNINQNNTSISNLYLYGYDNASTCSTCGGAITVNATGINVNNIQISNSFDPAGTSNYAIQVLANATVTFTNGGSYCSSPSSSAHQAGGMYIFGTGITAIIKDYVFDNNYTGASGGNLLIDNYAGGGSWNTSTTKVYVQNSRFQDMTGAGENVGVAIEISGGSLTISDSYFNGNSTSSSATINEGVISVDNKAAGFTARRCVFTNNTGTNVHGMTIGVDATSANVVIDSCYFFGNSSTSAIGNDIYIKNKSSVSVDYCSFSASSPYSGVTPTHTGLYNASSPGPTLPGFSGGCGSSIVITPLPIKLLKFEGICSYGKVKITWTTATETNNNYFTIEKSTDAYNWEVLTTVPGAGNSNSLLNYSITDEEINNELHYYRLKQTDFNGKYAYSEIIAVKSCFVDNIDLVVAGNPVSNYMNVFVNSTNKQNIKFYIKDILGRNILTNEFEINKGENSLLIDVRNIKSGIYLVVMESRSNDKPVVKEIMINNNN